MLIFMDSVTGGRVEPFMEWVTRTGMDMEWVSGGYGYFLCEVFGAGWVME